MQPKFVKHLEIILRASGALELTTVSGELPVFERQLSPDEAHVLSRPVSKEQMEIYSYYFSTKNQRRFQSRTIHAYQFVFVHFIKIVAKILVERLKNVVDKLVFTEQAAFVPGHSISDNIFIA